MEEYSDNTGLRAAVLAVASVIPFAGGVVSAADAALMAHVEQIRKERLEVLLEELKQGREDFTGPIPIYLSGPVLHACHTTIEATLRTSRREKIRWFARLLLAGVAEHPRISLATEHEDYLKILDDLSYRELGILATLAEFEQAYPEKEGEETPSMPWNDELWEKFQQKACERLGIPADEFSGLLARLNRTGAYETIVASFYGYNKARGNLTPTYYRLASIIHLDTGEFDTGQIV